MTFFFVFTQLTAYVLRISDWSSDVCSSVLSEHEVEERHLDEAAELTEQAGKRDKIDNTHSETWTAGGGISLINDGGQLGISIGYFDTNYGVPARPNTAHDHGGEEEEGGHDHGEGPVTIGMKQWRADLRGEVEQIGRAHV